MAKTRPYYITTAISYPNDVPHIGHAYEAVATDALARFRRLQGMDVFFLTGTDEHGVKMLQTAKKQGITPAELADRNTPRFRDMVAALDCSNDDFIRTREERHKRACEELWRRMEKNGDIYLDKYAGWYSVRDEAYYDESELKQSADGQKLSPQGTPVEWVEEESYFFRLSAYQDKLLAHYEAHPEFIGPDTRANEVKSFVRGGLQDLSISRTTFDWGIPVPGDPKHIMYVWVDALTNYLTGVGFPDEQSPKFKRYWPADVHIIGKDIIRFHAVYWPAFLMSAGVASAEARVRSRLSLQSRREDVEVGRQRGRSLRPCRRLRRRSAPLLPAARSAVRPGRQLQPRRHRPAHQCRPRQRSRQSRPALAVDDRQELRWRGAGNRESSPRPTRRSLPRPTGCFARVTQAIDDFAIHRALEIVWAVIADANRYFAGEEPWAHKKTNPKRMETILYVTAEVLRQIAILVQPVMPGSAARLLDQLGVPQDARDFAQLGPAGRLKPGTKLPPPQGGVSALCRGG